jgi:hypothetical protein
MILLMNALWKVSLMLVPNRLLLNREYILMNVLKALVSIISMYIMKNYTEIFYVIYEYKWNVSSIQCKM